MRKIVAFLFVALFSLGAAAQVTTTVAANPWLGSAPASFTPALAFGGASTGITYSTRVGSYERIGNTIRLSLNVALSSKGSATGAATITGLPVASKNTTGLYHICRAWAISLDSAVGSVPLAHIAPNSSLISLTVFASGSVSSLTDAGFADTSDVIVSCDYEI